MSHTTRDIEQWPSKILRPLRLPVETMVNKSYCWEKTPPLTTEQLNATMKSCLSTQTK